MRPTGETLACWLFSHRLDESEDMHSLLLTDNSTLLVGGLQNHILEIDLNTVQETQKVRPTWDLKSWRAVLGLDCREMGVTSLSLVCGKNHSLVSLTSLSSMQSRFLASPS